MVKIYDDLSNDDLLDLFISRGSLISPTANPGIARPMHDALFSPPVRARKRAAIRGTRSAKYSLSRLTQTKSMPAESVVADEGSIGPWKLNTTHNVECLSALKQIPDDTLDVVVTSPPYWGQRGNFGLGLEPDPRDFVRNLVSVLAEAMRCLKPSGTLWLNIGDSYNTPINWREEDFWTPRRPQVERKQRIKLTRGFDIAALEPFLFNPDAPTAQLTIVDAISVWRRVTLGVHSQRDRQKTLFLKGHARWHVILNALRDAGFDVGCTKNHPLRGNVRFDKEVDFRRPYAGNPEPVQNSVSLT